MYLQTIESEKSLVKWTQNQNKSNVFTTDELLLKEFYFKFFNEFAKNSKNYDFLKIWYKHCNSYISDIKKFLSNRFPGITDDSKNVICNKFRGNIAEILIEALIKFGRLPQYLTTEYYPVENPAQEEYIDGMGKDPNSDLNIGIQIKNFNSVNLITRDIFDKAMTMRDRFAERFEDEKYNKNICQMIISFSNVQDDRVLKNTSKDGGYKNRVIFFGPEQIKMLYLGGNARLKICPASKIFEEIFPRKN